MLTVSIDNFCTGKKGGKKKGGGGYHAEQEWELFHSVMGGDHKHANLSRRVACCFRTANSHIICS